MVDEQSRRAPAQDPGSGPGPGQLPVGAVEVEEVRAEEPQESRKPRHWWTLAALAVVLMVVPGVLGSVLGEVLGAVGVVAAALVCVLLGPFALGFLDGRQFRVSWTFPLLAALFFMISKGLYYQDAAWIYVIPVVLLAWGGAALGEQAGAPRDESAGEKAGQPEGAARGA